MDGAANMTGIGAKNVINGDWTENPTGGVGIGYPGTHCTDCRDTSAGILTGVVRMVAITFSNAAITLSVGNQRRL
jgi:hypothetical protein